jgi:acyl CoA:acetate/3-ketoacid CoA transferase alpha subunit
MNFGPIMATACTTTIVEARLLLEEPLPHNHIQLPSVYVDYLIESEETDHGS